MNPLVVLEKAEAEGKVPSAIAKRVRTREKYLTGAVRRVEKASELSFPPYYVEPVLPLARSGAEFGQTGVYYARVIPTTATGTLSILVQFTAALVAFGVKGTVEAVAAHEFTHYIDLVRRLSKVDLTSEERSTTLFESAYADMERTVDPKALFKDRALVNLVGRKFRQGLMDEKLNTQVQKKWVEKGLPVRFAATEENVIRVGMASVLSARFDPLVLAKVRSIEEKMKA